MVNASEQKARPSRKRARHVPERTCAGCRKAAGAAELLRIVRDADGDVVPDLGQSAFGRGAWVHADPKCVALAAPRGLSASFRAPVRTDAVALTAALHAAAEHRVPLLLGLARRAGKLALGLSPVEQAVKSGAAELVIVACDAGASAAAPWLESTVRAGRGAAWGSRARLGAALGREEVSAVAVLDLGLAQSIKGALAVRALAGPRSRQNSGVTEVS
jgi:predicted RNA-binding protein YlxR (DUF448 family)/ribosomal protein L7Ae-like RNA K-turn-binding protein